MAEFPEVLEVHHVAGEDCFLVKVRAKDTESLGRILRDRIGRHLNVSDAELWRKLDGRDTRRFEATAGRSAA